MSKFFKRYIIRISFLGCLFLHLGILHAQTYYVSSINGDDRNAGTSPATAWKTIDEVNRQLRMLRPGDSVLFERGGIYYGTITIPWNVNGLADYPITFGAYGEGDMPVISGAKQITDWVKIDNNLWKANVPEHPGSIDVLLINGGKYYPARFPNKGYRTVTDRYSNGLQDRTLNFPDEYWNGATLAYRTSNWNIFRDTVVYSFANGRIDKAGINRTQIPNPGWGYFLQNHINAIDTIGEWAYDKHDGSITLCTLENPNEQLIEYMFASYGIRTSYQMNNVNCFIIIENLCIQHYKTCAIYAHYGKNIEIRHNVIKNCKSGIGIGGFDECLILENNITDMEDNGLRIGNLKDSRIHNNILRRIALSLDGGQNGNSGYGLALGMTVNSHTPNDRCEITNNRLDSIGYDGIFVTFSQNSLIKNNVINYSMFSLTDGGAIYLGTNPAYPPLLNNKVIDNIVMNTIGNSAGTRSNIWAHGIYLDDGIGDYEVQGNTVTNSTGGIFFHGAHSNFVHHNVLYNNIRGNIISQDDVLSNKVQIVFRNNNLQNNYMYKNEGITYQITFNDPEEFSRNTIDNNYISAPFSQYFANLNYNSNINRTTWISKTDFDLHSRTEPVPYVLSGAESSDEFAILVYNPTPRDSAILLEHTYMSFDSIIHAGSIHLQPFESAILFRCKDTGELLDIPVGETSLCIGTSSIYFVPESLDLIEVDSVTWIINPPAAGVIKSVSGSKGSVIEVVWLPNFKPSPAQLIYSVQLNDGSSRISKPLTVDLDQDIGRPSTPTGPIEIPDITIPGIFTADNPDNTEIEWIVPVGIGVLFPYDHYGNTVTVGWNQNLLGTYTITYRLRNSCGEWGAEAFPLFYSFPVATPKGPDNLCEEIRTCYTAPPYTDITSELTWVLVPSNAGYLESNGNEVCVTLSKNAGNEVVLYYKGLNNYSLPFQSPALTLNRSPLPTTPAKPTGPSLLSWGVSSSNYTADTGWDDYDWQILPPSAGTISKIDNTATINWVGSSDHDYAGQVQISYRIKESDNSCGFSDYSSTLTVTLLPKPPTTNEANPCAGTQTSFTTKTYLGAFSYRWTISPSSAGTAINQTNTTTIAWSPSFSGEAKVSYSVIDVAGRAYSSESVPVNIRALPTKPRIANGPTSVDWNIPTSTYVADSEGDSYEWLIDPATAGTIIANGNLVTVHWDGEDDHSYAGQVQVSYRITKTDNNCGFSESSPALPVNLLPKLPTTSENNPCAGTSTVFDTRPYTNVSSYQWNINPENAGTITSQVNAATITWSETFSGQASISYSLIDIVGRAYTSLPIQVTVQPLPATPPQASGKTVVKYSESITIYTASNGWSEYLWEISPAEASTAIQVDGTKLSVSWNKNYIGQVDISYKVRNTCGWSPNSSPVLTVTLQPAPPVMDQLVACNNRDMMVSAPSYQNVSAYQWHISPSGTGQIDSDDRQAMIQWSNLFTGEAEVYYTVTNSEQESFSSPQILILVKEIPAKPSVAFGPDKVYLNHPIETYQATSTGIQYEWKVTPLQAAEIQNSASENTSILWSSTYLGEATIEYRVQNECGWSEMSDPLVVQVYQSDLLEDIPRIFTPNGDGFNDTWDIPAIYQYPDAVVRIYNRAKRLMVEFKGAQLPWDGRDRDGKILESGYYLYQIELQKGGGVVSGYVTILR